MLKVKKAKMALYRRVFRVGACSALQHGHGGAKGRVRPRRRSELHGSVVGRNPIPAISEEGWSLPHRACQRLYRQYLAHPDGADGKSLRRPAGCRRRRGIQGRDDRRDVPAQISAINNFIDAGYDAVVVNAQNPTAFGPVIKRAEEAGVVLVAFDNILDTKDAINVNVDQKGLVSSGPIGW